MKSCPERRRVGASGLERIIFLGDKTLKILRKLTLTFGSALAALGIFAVPLLIPTAYAQEGASEVPQLDEIVVTSRKRDERLIDAPLTITVLSAEDIQIKGIDNYSDIVDFTPGFFVGGPSGGNADRSSRRLLIRGMQPSTDRQTQQSASVYIDGAPVLGAEIGDTAGAERIEVIKGPQSAYFGRSSFGGAINVITKTPGHEWIGQVSAEAGQWDTSDLSVELEGPLIMDKLAMRVSAGQDSFGGQYLNAANSTEMLGSRKTTDFSLTFYATPTDNFTAKLRLHAWEDEDGETTSMGYGLDTGPETFNCNLGGTAGSLTGVAGDPNYICGTPRFPTPDEIGTDSISTPEMQAVLNNECNPGCTFVTKAGILDGYGLAREAFSSSLIMDYEFGNGMTLSSITAAHTNDMRRAGDFDYVVTPEPYYAPNADGDFTRPRPVIIIGDRALEDFSQEIRLMSAGDGSLRWMVGASYSDIEEALGSGNNFGGGFPSASNPSSVGAEVNISKTAGFFGSASYDFTDSFTVSVEARVQEDEVISKRSIPTITPVSGTFNSFTPRIIIDYSPGDNMTVYGSFAQGNHPGVFNSNMIDLETRSPSVFACVDAAIFSGVEVPEETLDNFEVGFKGLMWDGRAEVTVAAYYGQWRDQHNRGQVACPGDPSAPAGDPAQEDATWQTFGVGGETDISGLELEFRIAVTDNFMIDGTYALNKTEILKRDSADGLVVLGNRELAGLGKMFSRYPENSGTLSGTFRGNVRGDTNFFARVDFIYKSGKWATDANIAKTQDENRINLRTGLEIGEDIRLEAYVTNLTDDDTFTGFQNFPDLGNTGGRRLLTLGLPVKRTFGVRATYRFDIGQ
jgi:iron complex outermembrane receptor protein